MLTFSTDNFRPHERFDHWCEVRARNLFGVTISLRQEERLHFQGRFSASAVGGAVLSQMQASSYMVSRTRADISRASSDSLCIYQQVGGESWFDARSGGEFVVPAGHLAISHSDLPYLTTPLTSHGFDLRVLKIPLAGREGIALHGRGLPPSLLRDDSRLKRAISASFNALVAEAAKHPDADFDGAVGHLAQLALLARGRVSIGSPESRAALRFGLLQAIRDTLRCNLHRPDLSPAAVAAEFAISVRQLHLLFEPTGVSFSRTLLAMRLAAALQRLEVTPSEPPAAVAFACGFDSIATFYRAFRNAYSMTPSDARMAARINRSSAS